VIFRRVLAMVTAACLTACATGGVGGSGGAAVIDSGERYQAATSGVEDYKLGFGDKLRVTVFNEPALSGEFAVSSEGNISMPLIGTVVAGGLAPDAVTRTIQGKLAEGYLRDPKVSAEVITYRPFFILGEVKAPGQYPYATGLTVVNAVATAQGFTPRSNRNVALIRRAGSTEEQPYRLTPELRVLPGDTIRIGERFF
jgi:polysaccharide export outer membrane protein